MLLSPLTGVLAGLNFQDPGEILASYGTADGGTFYDDAVVSGAVARVSSSLAALICAETGIPTDDMDISLTTERVRGSTDPEVTVTAVTVTLYRRAHKVAAEKVCAAVERVMICPCKVNWEVRENA